MAEIKVPDRAELGRFMKEAIKEAEQGYSEGGVPIGSVLVRNGEIIGRGHNRRVQHSDPTAHGEIDCLRAAGRQRSYRDTVLYSTLMPCSMCAGAAAQFKVPIVVAGENRTFKSAYDWMESNGIKVIDMDMDECFNLLAKFAKENPEIWKEDIGEL